ncbi:MAG: hypothetical protein PF518_00985 [Spirochaetaceae bacterium]|jgi:hypothetical protein|nr:hypothetical protein [Spirochaetaceae bacterium]
MTLNLILPFLSSLISLILTFFIFKRFALKKKLHLLFWGIGMAFYGLGGFCEGYFGVFGWNELIFRFWYLFGAILVAAWLGQGSVYLLWPNKKASHLLTILLIIGSIYSVFKVAGASLDPSLMTGSLHTGSELSGHAITTPGVRILTPFFNLYGTMTLVGGAIWSTYIFYKKRILLHRTIGSILIALGAIAPAFGGTASRYGIPNALYLGEFLGVVLIFLGFLRATNPIEDIKEKLIDIP